MKQMFLSVVLLASLDKATLFVEHPQVAFNAPAVLGKSTTPTPTGVYLLKKAYSQKLDMPILIFREDDGGVYAIHPNLKTRTAQIKSAPITDNYLSGGCIGVEASVFDKLWAIKQPVVLQVY